MKIKTDVSPSKLLYTLVTNLQNQPGEQSTEREKKNRKETLHSFDVISVQNDLKCQNNMENKNHVVQDFMNDFLGKI